MNENNDLYFLRPWIDAFLRHKTKRDYLIISTL